MGVQNPALARMVGRTKPQEQAAPAAEPLSPSRRLRGAVMRAADRSIGLALSVMGVSETRVDAETLVADAPEDWVIIGLARAGQKGLAGLALIDLPLRSAAIEVQTLGKLQSAPEQERPATGLDAELLMGFVQRCLSELAVCELEAMPRDVAAMQLRHVPSMRAADLALPDLDHQLWQMSVQIGASERQGNLHLAFSLPAAEPAPAPQAAAPALDWAAAMTRSVRAAHIPLEAELHRMRSTVGAVTSWTVGQRIDLPGANVANLRLVRAGQGTIAIGRLGQMSGARAIRIEPPQLQMQEGVPLGSAAAGPSGAEPEASDAPSLVMDQSLPSGPAGVPVSQSEGDAAPRVGAAVPAVEGDAPGRTEEESSAAASEPQEVQSPET